MYKLHMLIPPVDIMRSLSLIELSKADMVTHPTPGDIILTDHSTVATKTCCAPGPVVHALGQDYTIWLMSHG